jgi:flagellar biosynthetic protein FlhB
MAEEQLGQERSEEPTSKRLDEARKKGQVARSRELNTFLVVVGGLTFLWMTSNQLSSATGSLMSEFLSPTDELMTNPDLLLPYLGSGLQLGILVVSPLLLVTVFLALVGPGIMGGVTFSVDALAFKPEKLDPIKGLTRIFSTKGLVELLKALLKFFLIAGISILLFFSMQTEIMSLTRLNVVEGIARSGEIIIWAALCAALSLAVVALIDIPFQIWDHTQQLKMTKQQVKDESKETEGRPEVKARIRQLQHQAAQRRMLEDVPKADVVITNPTHYSVALKYDSEGDSAPIVVAKGADLIAFKIRSIASEHKVPIYSEPPLARAIFGSTEIGDEIPAPLFLAVARVLAYVFQLARASATDYVPRPDALPLPDEFDQFNNEGSLNGL